MILVPNKIVLRIPSKPLFDVDKFDINLLPNDFLDSLILASPGLYSKYKNYSNLDDKSKNKIYESLYKYWVRNCIRCTPFGTFTGLNLIPITSNESSVFINSFDTKTRLDIQIIRLIIESLKTKTNIIESLELKVNNTLYEYHNELRFLEKINPKYVLSAVDNSPLIQLVINKINNTSNITFCQLVEYISSSENISSSESNEYIQTLIDNQIIETILEVETSGIEPLESLISKVSHLQSNIVLKLINLQKILNLDINIQEKLSSTKILLSEIDGNLLNENNIFQVDNYFKASENEFNSEQLKKIIDQTQKIIFLSRKFEHFELNEFKKNFRKKYEDSEVKLVIALDADAGLGYSSFNSNSLSDSELLNNIGGSYSIKSEYSNDHLARFITYKFNSYLTKNEEKIVISDSEIAKFENLNRNEKIPQSMLLMGSLINNYNSDFKFRITALAGNTCTKVITRFSNTSDSIDHYIKDLYETEKEVYGSDIIFTEINHEPLDRGSNLVFKKSIRSHEISFGGKSKTGVNCSLNINDLYLKLVGNDLFLISKSLGKRIIPVISHAHNYLNSPSHIYQFLCDLQNDNRLTLNLWDWGIFSSFSYLPRVEYKNIIIKKSRWLIEQKEITPLFENKLSNLKDLLFKEFNLPDEFYFVNGDRELLINLNNLDSIQMFRTICNNQSQIILEEFIPEEKPLVKNNDGYAYNNELIIPLILKDKQDFGYSNTPELFDLPRKLTPNSEWIYLKIYCGVRMADIVLMEQIIPLLNENELYNSFHFVRYYDDFPHLRIRFKVDNPNIKNHLIGKLNFILNQLVLSNKIHSFGFDTYIRELERYGGSGIIPSEDLFYVDSTYVLKLISLLNEVEEPMKFKFILALRSIDEFLNDFEFNDKEKLTIMNKLSESFLHEFGNSKTLIKLLKKKYYSRKNEIFNYLNKSNDIENELLEVVNLFNERSVKLKVINKEISKIYSKTDVQELINSYIHMHFNRLFISQQRKYELVAYYFLNKYYESQIAISKKNQINDII